MRVDVSITLNQLCITYDNFAVIFCTLTTITDACCARNIFYLFSVILMDVTVSRQ